MCQDGAHLAYVLLTCMRVRLLTPLILSEKTMPTYQEYQDQISKLQALAEADGAIASVTAAPATLAFAFSEAGRAFAEALRGRQPEEAPEAAAGPQSPDDNWPLEPTTPEPAVKSAGRAAAKVAH